MIELKLALFPDGLDKPPRLKDESAQAWTLNALANSYSLSGQPRQAVPLFIASNDIDEKRGEKTGVAIGLGNLASMAQLPIGALREAEANLRRSIALCREIEDEFWEAVGHQVLGRVLGYAGWWGEAEEELRVALEMFEKDNNAQSQGIVWAYRALRALMMERDLYPPKSPRHRGEDSSSPSPLGGRAGVGSLAQEALAAARRALELADETARTQYPYERDYIRAHWMLGAAYRVNGEGALADQYLTEALTRCRGINEVMDEADILLEVARLRWGARGEEERGEEVMGLLTEALAITERSGYVLQGADVHLLLAEVAWEAGDKKTARAHAVEARRLATCDGPPDYTYKVAYEEAGRMIERMKDEGGNVERRTQNGV